MNAAIDRGQSQHYKADCEKWRCDLDATWGRCLSGDGKVATDERLAKQWIGELDQSMVKVLGEILFSWWNSAVNVTDENGKLVTEANLKMFHFFKETRENASRFDWQNFTDSSLVRQFRNILAEFPQFTDNEARTLIQLRKNMTDIWDPTNGTNTTRSPDLTNATSRGWDELLLVWNGRRNVSGMEMKSLYSEMVKLLNQVVKRQGYRDYGEYWRSMHEMENLSSACEELWQQVKPLYQQLHTYVRRKLMQSYPNNTRNFPNTRHIPAHLTEAQTWKNIPDLVKPFPNSSMINITKILLDQVFNALRMFREADSFFTSLGFPPMTEEFWNHSLIEKPKDGREVICSPFSYDFHNRRDFRIRFCTNITEDDFVTAHQLIGQIQYFIHYRHQPATFKFYANQEFVTSVGDVFSLSITTPEHLRNVHLLNNITDSYGSEINHLMKQALGKVVLLPFYYLIDRWRWGVYDGTITPDNYNRNYWKLRCGLQGISPPSPRSDDNFDIGSDFDIIHNTPSISYFLSNIITFQFHKCLCDAAGHVGPLHKCDIYKSRRAGFKLRRMMSLGSSKHWQDAMEIMTGQRNMDAGPLLEYFRPLHDWLRKENQGHEVGWDEDCPSGSLQ